MTGLRPVLTLAAVAAASSATGLMLARERQPMPVARPAVRTAPSAVMGGRVVYPASQAPVLRSDGVPPFAVHSLLHVDRRMGYGEHVWNETGAGTGPLTVRVDLSRQVVSVFRGGDEIGTSVILYGADDRPTPVGTFPVLARARSHRSSLYDAPMPYMLRLTGDGVALHGSSVEKGYATHGCIGLPDEFARRLYEAARVGDLVTIVRT